MNIIGMVVILQPEFLTIYLFLSSPPLPDHVTGIIFAKVVNEDMWLICLIMLSFKK